MMVTLSKATLLDLFIGVTLAVGLCLIIYTLAGKK